ncbi:hypothetical protein NC652_033324 [Populus alba x Populus x berolinensis]|nr:hypothetical protein NC652_033324 [Populus alba x Populus x berolinensis]
MCSACENPCQPLPSPPPPPPPVSTCPPAVVSGSPPPPSMPSSGTTYYSPPPPNSVPTYAYSSPPPPADVAEFYPPPIYGNYPAPPPPNPILPETEMIDWQGPKGGNDVGEVDYSRVLHLWRSMCFVWLATEGVAPGRDGLNICPRTCHRSIFISPLKWRRCEDEGS